MTVERPMNLEDQVGHYKALVEAARRFGRAMELDALLDEILDRSREVMDCEACSILLPDPKTDELILYSTHSKVAALEEAPRIPPGQGIAGHVFATRKSLNNKDVQADKRHYTNIDKKLEFVVRAMLTIPLMNGAECLGVMQALNPHNRPHFTDQCEEIFEGFGGLIVNALLRLDAEKQKLEQAQATQELHMAREIQNSFLPPEAQDFPFCQVHLRYYPARAVSGDFYFLHQVDKDRLLLGLGDVSGKGIPAALTMARATAMIKAMSDQVGENLGDWVSHLNNRLIDDMRGGRFIGMTFMLANVATRSLQVCAAGQYPPLCYNGREWASVEAPQQMALGILEEIPYSSTTLELKPGQQWMLFSDGITEARNPAGEEFSVEEFAEIIPRGECSKEAIKATVKGWREFVGNAPQHDDASLLLLDWRGLQPPPVLETTCCLETLCACRDFIERWAQHVGFSNRTAGMILMAGDEAVTNVFRHAYKEKPGPLKYEAGVEDGSFVVRITDEAGRIDTDCIKGRDLDDLRPGGLGTNILASVFDEVKYDTCEQGTTLTLKKKLP